MEKTIYDFSAMSIDKKKDISLSEFKGQVLLIVNTASKCGFTQQYEGLEQLYQKFKESGFTVLGFPCNQFGAQEPGDEEEIKSFCSLTYNVSFPMFAKIEVNGDNAHPLYKFLKKESKGVLGTEGIKWNFTKFLVSRSGKDIERFAPTTSPRELAVFVEKLLQEKE